MALVARYGRPDYFVTMTCNPYWLERIEQLLPGQTPQDRPDIVARLYHAVRKMAPLREMTSRVMVALFPHMYFGDLMTTQHLD